MSACETASVVAACPASSHAGPLEVSTRSTTTPVIAGPTPQQVAMAEVTVQEQRVEGRSADAAPAPRFHTCEELEVDPDELPSPVLGGTASLLAFSLGALLPLLPYLLGIRI